MYDRRHFKLTFGGQVGDDIDEWSTGIRIAPVTLGAVVDWPAAVTQIGQYYIPVVETLWQSVKKYASVGIDLRWLKLAAIGTDGKYVPGIDPYIFDFEAAIPGTAGGSSGGPQSAVVLSLRTNRNRGAATKGRMYLPLTGMTASGTTFKLSSTYTGQIADAGKTFIEQLRVVNETTTFGPYIMSGIGNGAINGINYVLVGDMLDTQRRRRNKFTEEYVSRTIEN